jgi:hypothetical protein
MGGMNDSSMNISSSVTINQTCDSTGDEAAPAPTKTIGFLYSFCLHLNNLTGPALVLLPLINQEAGWLPCTLGALPPPPTAPLTLEQACSFSHSSLSSLRPCCPRPFNAYQVSPPRPLSNLTPISV